jgi:DNA-binding NarL/FixJ family response regulator
MTTTKKITIGLVENDIQFGRKLQQYLNQQPQFNVLICCNSVEQLKSQLLYLKTPDILLMGMDFPGLSGLDGLRLVKQDSPNTQVMILTHNPHSDKVFAALGAGAGGYLLKDTCATQITNAIIELHSGGAPLSPSIARKVINHFSQPAKPQLPSLTPREQQIVDTLVEGLSYKQIANRLSIALETVRHHIKNIYSKWQVHSKSRLIALVNASHGAPITQ